MDAWTQDRAPAPTAGGFSSPEILKEGAALLQGRRLKNLIAQKGGGRAGLKLWLSAWATAPLLWA